MELLTVRVSVPTKKGWDNNEAPIDDRYWHTERFMQTVSISHLLSVGRVVCSDGVNGKNNTVTLYYDRKYNKELVVHFDNAPLAFRGRRAIFEAWLKHHDAKHAFFPATPVENKVNEESVQP